MGLRRDPNDTSHRLHDPHTRYRKPQSQRQGNKT